MPEHYDLVVAGTGFASSFFLSEWLKSAPATARVLVLERGPDRSHADRMAKREVHQRTSHLTSNATKSKPWVFSSWFGGGSRCWAGCTPRMMPNDFALRTRYGKGTDWPLTYDELEPYYCEAEAVMQISGPRQGAPWPMSKPYPQPPHVLTPADHAFLEHYPGQLIPQPCARPRVAAGDRPACCNNSACSLCPIDSKFTVVNALKHVYDDPRVTVRFDTVVHRLVAQGSAVRAVRYRHAKKKARATADLVAIGCNALFNPWLLLRSDIDQGPVGRFLAEQRARIAVVDLDGVESFRSSTVISGLITRFADGEHRRERAACIIETHCSPRLMRVDDPKRALERWFLKFIFEDIPIGSSRVTIDPKDPMKPLTTYDGPSDYLRKSAFEGMEGWLQEVLEGVPHEGYRLAPKLVDSEAHILCSHRMGDDPETSVTDRNLVHHKYRNLLVLGGGAFPSCPPANPSLTIAALSLRAARELRS